MAREIRLAIVIVLTRFKSFILQKFREIKMRSLWEKINGQRDARSDSSYHAEILICFCGTCGRAVTDFRKTGKTSFNASVNIETT